VNGCTIPVTGTQTLTETPLTLQSTKKDNTVCNGSGGTGCTATGTTVVLNEVRHFPPGPQGIVSTGTEYVELYNPTCSPIDISCYMIGTRANSISGGTIILPQGTILEPKAHFVIGTSSSSANTVSVDFKTNQNTSNYCVTGPNFLLANGDGWISLYDKSGTVVDAIYWTISDNQPGKIDNDDDLDDNPCTPSSVNGCATSGISLLSAKQINVQFPDRIVYVGRATSQTGNPLVSNGKAFSRIPDGGSWQRDIDPSIDGSNCNNSQCDTPPSGGTCDGSVSVTVSSGSGDYSYQWKDSLNTVIATTASVSNLCAGKYCVIVTDNVSGCIDSTCVTIVDDIKQQTNPTFNLPASICEGTTAPVLNTTSDNGIKGSWSPDTVDNQNTTSYTFTPDAGQCAKDTTITINVNKKVEPTFAPVAGFCQGAILTQVLLPETSTNGITGTWNPPGLSSDVAGDIKYIFTPGAQFCADTTSITVTVTPKPSLDPIANVVVTDGDVVSAINFNSNPSGATYSWTNSQSGIGLAASGTGNLPSFTAINLSDADVVATITVTPSLNTCGGTARTFTITVKPRTKDIFVPNVFSPNGDGKNDQLKVYGNYITKLQMVIFNQWGEQIIQLNNVNQGWDGTHKGKPQPVGVYVYVLKATLSTGKEVTKKGSITLVR
jgi:gliding motility-associated-like protein